MAENERENTGRGNLSEEDRKKGGERSSTEQNRDEGQFEGR